MDPSMAARASTPYAVQGLDAPAAAGIGFPNRVASFPSSAAGAVLGAATGPSTPAAPPSPAATGAFSPAAMAASFASEDRGVQGTAGGAITQGGAQLNSAIQDLIASRTAGQNAIDAATVNNMLAKDQGTQSVLDMVGNGIRSGGVTLDNMNASDSSAAQALADAYGLQGRQQLSSVGNQAQQGANTIANQQTSQNLSNATASRHISEDKTNIINSIVENARNQLQNINASQAGYAAAGLHVDVPGETAAIKARAMAALQGYDTDLSNAGQTAQPMGESAAQAKAATLAAAGTAAPTTFNYTTGVPGQIQGTGPVASTLPLFALPSSTKTTTGGNVL